MQYIAPTLILFGALGVLAAAFLVACRISEKRGDAEFIDYLDLQIVQLRPGSMKETRASVVE